MGIYSLFSTKTIRVFFSTSVIQHRVIHRVIFTAADEISSEGNEVDALVAVASHMSRAAAWEV